MTEPRQLAALVRLLVRTVGPRVARRAAPVWLVAVIVASLVFHHNGMDPRELVSAAAASAGLRLALLGAWTALMVPAAREVHRSPVLAYVLALPVGRGLVAAVVGVMLAALHLPALLLWAHGGTAVLPAAAVSLGLTAALATPLTGASLIALAALVATVALGWSLGASLAGVVVALLGLRHLVGRAGEAAAGGSSTMPRRAPLLALVIALLTCLWRRDRVVLVRALLATAVGGLLAWLPIVNNHVTARQTVAALVLGVGAVSATIGAFGVGQRLAALEAREGWLLDALGVAPGRRWTAVALAAAAVLGPLGLAHGGLVAWLVRVEPWFAGSLAVVSASSFASLAVLAARPALSEALAGAPSAAGRVVVALAVMIAAQAGAAYAGELAAIVLLVIAGVAAGPWLAPAPDVGLLDRTPMTGGAE